MVNMKRAGAGDPQTLKQCIVRAAGYPPYRMPDAGLGGERFRRWLADNAVRHMLGFFAQAIDDLGASGAGMEAKLRSLRARGRSCSFHDEIVSLAGARERARQTRPAAFVFRWTQPDFFVRVGKDWRPVDLASRSREYRGTLFAEWKRLSRRVSAGQPLLISSGDLRSIGLMLCVALDELRNGAVAPAILGHVRTAPRPASGLRAELRAQTAP